jgi:hypothetical protein
MTITTPPEETRTRRTRRGDDAAAPPRRRTPPPKGREDREDTVAAGTVKTRPARTGAAKTGAAKTGAAKTGAAKTGAAKTGAAKTGAAKTGAAKTGAGKRATAAGTRAAPATAPRVRRTAAPRKPPPKAAPSRRSATPPRAPFVLLVVGLLGGALVSLLLLNTVLAQDAFTLSELQRGNQQLSERKQALQVDIAREKSPSVLHSEARNLGMVDGQRPAFIDPRTGRVTESGTRPPGVSDEAMAAAAGAGVTGAPGAIMPPTGGGAPRTRAGGGTR